MNKDELQIGDLVNYWTDALDLRVGLVIDDLPHKTFIALRYRVYWFKTGSILRHSRNSLIRLEIPNE
jgi:hypothetical protein